MSYLSQAFPEHPLVTPMVKKLKIALQSSNLIQLHIQDVRGPKSSKRNFLASQTAAVRGTKTSKKRVAFVCLSPRSHQQQETVAYALEICSTNTAQSSLPQRGTISRLWSSGKKLKICLSILKWLMVKCITFKNE